MPYFVYVIYIIFELFLSFFAITVAVAATVVQGLGFMKIAQKVGVKNGWMAFIPFAGSLLLGRLAEESDRRAYPEKEPRKWGKLLLTVNIVFSAFIFVLSIIYSIVILAVVFGTLAKGGSGEGAVVSIIIGSIAAWLIMVLSYFALTAAYLVVYYLVIYRIYRMMAGRHAGWMLALSICTGAAVTVLAAIFGFGKKFPLPSAPGAAQTDAPVQAQQAEQPQQAPYPADPAQ